MHSNFSYLKNKQVAELERYKNIIEVLYAFKDILALIYPIVLDEYNKHLPVWQNAKNENNECKKSKQFYKQNPTQLTHEKSKEIDEKIKHYNEVNEKKIIWNI